MQYYIGCSGWSYSSWQGHFYPKGIENSKWLKYYSKVFNYVEIDSSFYRIPNEFMVKNWYKRTPEDFRFTAKFPKVITHDKRLSDFDEDQLSYFFESISELKEKLLALIIQLPPSIDIVEGLSALRNILPYLDKGFRYAVEVRHRSWFQDLAYNFFRNNQMSLVWSLLSDIKTPPIVTSDFVYVRLIGDRSIQEKDFGTIQIDRIKEMKKVARNFKDDNNEGKLIGARYAIVAANNHYAGFGPGTVNIFRQLIGLEEVKWGDEFIQTEDLDAKVDVGSKKQVIRTKQTSLSDFLK
ncbi:MAG TPA: DUF72 domain-containing protein [Nitrososphaeraceae archaeon]|nr:DUF72 domain-containing protein [Nitrososphaeraceae archaeon]